MKVITLNNQDFESKTRRLAEMARRFDPDIIIGILSGGGFVGRIFVRSFPDAKYLEIGSRRNSTGAKRHLRGLMKLLPRWATDRLRILEAKWLAKRHSGETVPPRDVALDESMRMSLRNARRILIVDDAVDSGATMAGVAEAVRKANPGAEIRTAAITVTTLDPIIRPDYRLYDSGILIRFPWSNDFN